MEPRSLRDAGTSSQGQGSLWSPARVTPPRGPGEGSESSRVPAVRSWPGFQPQLLPRTWSLCPSSSFLSSDYGTWPAACLPLPLLPGAADSTRDALCGHGSISKTEEMWEGILVPASRVAACWYQSAPVRWGTPPPRWEGCHLLSSCLRRWQPQGMTWNLLSAGFPKLVMNNKPRGFKDTRMS